MSLELISQHASMAEIFAVWCGLIAVAYSAWAALLSPFIIAAWIRDNIKGD